ncbi:hypothetical protein WN943_018547 [Citrus x changshan-huyou]
METDLVASSKGKLVNFRMKELKDVLTKLGLPKQGKKQDLVDRIFHQLSDEGVARIIDDTYRKMQISEAADLAIMGQSGLDICNVKVEMEAEDSLNLGGKIFCPCGTSLPSESKIQCVDPRCLVQQHISCVIIPEKPMEEIRLLPPLFFCETCRIKRADPFWITVAHLVSPMKLVASNIPTDGTNPLQKAEAAFHLTKAHSDLLQNTEYDVQAWCILLNDKVSFRMQWPLHAELQVNGTELGLLVRTVNRPGTQLLGSNGRDDGALITLYIGEGVNQISLSGCDARNFCFGVRLVKRRTVAQVLSLVPKETAGEVFEDALTRVRRCFGGVATGNEDGDSDLEIIADSIIVNLRCPMSGSRIRVAGRFKPCVHMGCFDLETFVELNQRTRKWQCPICMKNYSLEDLIIDPYFHRITTMMRNFADDLTEIEVKHDGSWRVKCKGENNNLAEWHSPDGSTYAARSEVVSNSETKQLVNSGQTIIARIKKNLSANVDVSKYWSTSPNKHMSYHVENNSEKIITMSSSASGCSRHEEDPTVNQDTNSRKYLNDIPHRIDPIFGTGNQTDGPIGDTDIIVLSDSEEDNDHLAPSTSYQSYHPIDSAPDGICESYFEDPAFDGGDGPCFGPFNGTVDAVGLSNWSYPSGTQAGSSFQVFDAVSNVSDVFVDLDHPSVACSLPMNGYKSPSKSTLTCDSGVLDSPVCHSNIDIGEQLIDISEQLIENTLPFVREDPSIGHFVPSQPTALFSESNSGNYTSENWISLRLGSTCADTGSHSQSATTNALELRSSCRPSGGRDV